VPNNENGTLLGALAPPPRRSSHAIAQATLHARSWAKARASKQ